MLEAHPDLTKSVINGLGWFYLLMFAMNLVWTVRSYRRDGYFESLLGFSHIPKAFTWAMYSTILLLVAIVHLTASSDSPDRFLLRLPEGFKNLVDAVIANPISYFAISMVLFVADDRAPQVVDAADCRLDSAQSVAAVSGGQHDGLRLPSDRRQAGQCPDRRHAVPGWLLHVAVLLQGGRERPPDRTGPAR